MRDPHVEELVYALKPDDTVRYHNPPSLSTSTSRFSLRLEDATLYVAPQDHFDSVEAARMAVKPLLKAWETHVYLASGSDHLRFEYAGAKLIDRNPPKPGEPQVIQAGFARSAAQAHSPTIIHTRTEYPQLPSYEVLSPDAATLAGRYRGYKEGREPLSSMAYFCRTVVQNQSGGLREASSKYHVHFEVLRKLGDLSSTRGGSEDARKFSQSNSPLSEAERIWLDTAIRRLIEQVAVVDSGGTSKELTMSALPKL